MRRSIGITALVVALALAGCSSEKVLDKDEVEQSAKDAVTEQVGQAPESVTCPEDLEAKEGASERCTLTADDGSEIGMTVTVTSIEGDKAEYEVEVDSQ